MYPIAQPNGSLLAYLFADRLLPSSQHGLGSDGWQHRISPQMLVVLLYSVALWSLREQRFVAIEHGKAGFMRATRTQRGTFTDIRLLYLGSGSGLEGAIVELLGRDQSRTLTPANLKKAFKGTAPVEQDAVAGGYQRTLTGARRAKNSNAEFAKERVAELEPAFADLYARWHAFLAAEPQTYQALASGVQHAEGFE